MRGETRNQQAQSQHITEISQTEGGGKMDKKIQELNALAKPLIEFLETHYNPYCKIVIDRERVVIVQDALSMPV